MENEERQLFRRLVQAQEQIAQCTCDAALALRCIDQNLKVIAEELKKLVPQPTVAKSATLTLHAN